ncbi:hypothetical protein J4225_02110 [Candidatus Pacearchaeota archaeon]|nr:hypothetical protein [Candidatus Pacearchaeota archaeon]
MAYLKRQKVPKTWPITRKGTAYVVKPSSNLKNGIPIVIALRDMLNLAQNRKEVKKAILEKIILINKMSVKNDRKAMVLFDVLSIVPSKKDYRLIINERGKFKLEEINEGEAGKKLAKIINKKTLKGKKVQLNLSDGRNILSKEKHNIGDSLILTFKENKIEKTLPLKDNSNVLIFSGKHSGTKGKIVKLNKESKTAEIDTGEKGKINVLIKQLMVIE